MFGLFKKAMTPDEFGRTVVSWANEFLVDDAGLSLARLFDEFWDDNRPDNGAQFLERMGIPAAKTHLYVRQFAHCAIHAASTQFGQEASKAMTRGAMTNYAKMQKGYDFETTYNALEAVYRGRHRFDRRIEALSNPEYDFPVLRNPNAGILNAKYLIETFVLSNVNNTAVLGERFGLYSGTVCGGLNAALRAMTQLSKSAKIA